MGQDGLQGVQALVIDDVSFTLQRLQRTLQDIGIPNVHAAPNGLAACAMMEKGEARPDLIVADFQMPDMNGVELLKRVRTGDVPGVQHDIFFVILTGFLELEKSVPALRLGVDGLLSKPLTAANAEKKLAALFKSDPPRDIRDAGYYAELPTDGGGPLDPVLGEPPGNEEKELPTNLVTPGVVLSRDLNYPNGNLLLPKGAIMSQALLQRMQELAELSGGVHRMWVFI